jgi:transposase
MVKLGQSRTSVGEYMHKDRKTVGNWVKAYNEQGINGLIPDYSKCGTKSKLTDQQLLKLKNTLTNPNKNYTLKDAKKLIELEFGVTYSYKQVWEIVRKKLGLNYRKPFIIYNEAPKDAENILLKKRY